MENIQVKQKILQMKYPEVTTYQSYANVLSILSHNEDNLSWIYNHFFQLVINKDDDFNFLNFNMGHFFIRNCPRITYHGLSRDFISSNWNSLTEFIISSINSGYYVSIVVDTYYIPAYEEDYMQEHFPHDTFIFGYDLNEQNFHIADFFKNGRYYYSTCHFENIEEGYAAQNHSEWNDWLNGCIMLKENPGYSPINISLLKNLINDYLLSKNSNKIMSLINGIMADDKFAYGMQVYDIIEKHVKKISNKLINFDIRPYHLLYDHKKYILLLIKYLHKQGNLNNSDYFYKKFCFIEKKALHLRDLVLRYKFSENKGIIDRIIAILKELANEEKQILIEMLDNIIEVPNYSKPPVDTYLNNESLYIEYGGEWEKENSQSSKAYYTEKTNDYVQFKFYGTSISYIGKKSKHCGYADIYIDGIKSESINLFYPEDICKYTLFSKNNLPLGHHVIRVVCSENNNPVSSGNRITIDGFKISCESDSKVKIKNEVVFIGIDDKTKGSWKPSFGNEGYEILGIEENIPHYANVRYIDAHHNICTNSTKDIRTLEIPNTSTRGGAINTYYKDFFTIDLIIAGNNLKNIAFYILDFIKGREVYVEMIDFETKEIISFQNVKNAYEGIYLIYKIKGHILINIYSKTQRDAVLSGIFFD